ncbi:hypothetical protein GJ629_04425 [Halapricum sp. CBA1109]|uniref:DUF7288 family protein n=1 Tax=Halapricum sp. CBA1109 TaxID=2668068 RepID=UPI0012FB02B0|nr:hypothetical protein [Halapricum sp. CBA1109]MUV89236.1 hypothetical protein [Halapricum sp. CBA1109]
MDRGQAHTLEGIVAALLLLSSLLFALQVTTVTPLSASTSSQHIENQQRAVGAGILASAADNGTLKPTVLYVNSTTGDFHGVDTGAYPSGGPPTAFGDLLESSLSQQGIAYNIRLVYSQPDGRMGEIALVDQGVASDNAVTVSRPVVLTKNDTLYNEAESPTDVTLRETQRDDDVSFYTGGMETDSSVFTVVTVEVTIWRI